ncbi:acetylcholinesterase-like [Schistocerca nitens]|uniref:acetylcholinesterase-like n=1 Tax=Schistocerca nitens TaxID=7011 RepID=UPI002118B0F4|nr:acetylcholinesterase-like [Schistocerca nitens]
MISSLVALVCVATISSSLAQDVYVTVEQGTLRGAVVSSALGTQYASFKGVPYARPPTGELRFQAPQAADSWEGVRDALEEGSACVQEPGGPEAGSEDCLYLNVHVPLNSSAPFAVYVLIPGGGFTGGSGATRIYGPDLFIEEGVAVVAINYRLGPLGYLSTQDEVIPGNAGMKDQVLALRWVNQNIAAFGGDPGRITAGGSSAGGCSVSHHLLSPSSAGLFQGLTIQSGDAISPWGIMADAREKAFRLGEVLGLSTNDSRQLLDFLLAQDAADLVSHNDDVITDAEKVRMQHLAWLPAIEPDLEGAFLTDSPINILRSGGFNKVPIIEGYTSGDGVIFVDQKAYLSEPASLQELNDNFELAVAPLLHLPTAEERSAAALSMHDFYFGHENITVADGQALVNMSTDLYFAEPADSAMRFVVNQSDAGPVYYYLFDYRGSELLNSTFGSWHAAETDVLFFAGNSQLPDPDSVYGRMRSNLVRLWSNFIKYGTPSPDGETIDWQPFTTSALKYMHITDDFQLSENVNKERIDFWHENIPW